VSASALAGFGLLVALVLVFVLARRRGRAAVNAALATARAEGGAAAALASGGHAVNDVRVSVGADERTVSPGELSAAVGGQRDDWSHLLGVLADAGFVVRSVANGLPARTPDDIGHSSLSSLLDRPRFDAGTLRGLPVRVVDGGAAAFTRAAEGSVGPFDAD